MTSKENERQNIKQKIGKNNTGTFQAINAGRDVSATQQPNSEPSSKKITQSEAIEYLTKIEELIKEADLPSEVAEKATDYTSMAKKEAQEKEPHKSSIIVNLERATSLIQKLNQTTDGTKELIDKLKPWFMKLTSWLGVAVNHFLG